MIISSTQFQQNVGYYLSQADKGEEIIIQKQRPKGISYKLVQETSKLKDPKEIKYGSERLKEIRKYSPGFLYDDPVEYQRWVRS